ncbi:MAG: glycosyltransferase [Bacilli bacterium]|nr:glycosyltransferase [Bacilli bacterium]
MKKISILALHLGYGGIEKSIVSLANVLCKRYQVEIATCYKLYKESVFPLDKKVKVVYLNKDYITPNHESLRDALQSKNIIRILKEGSFSTKVLYYRRKNMVRYLKKCDSDVIISTRDIFNTWSSLYARDEALKIGWEHNHFHEDEKYARKVVDSAKKLDYLVLVSNELQNYYQKRLSGSKCMCIYIPNCIDSFPPKKSSLRSKRLISVGRLSPEKGYLDLLKVYQILNQKYPDWKLDIIGDGKERKALELFIRSHHLEKSVTLHGFQSKDYIDQMMQDSSIYLMASHTESFGIVLIEAMSHGLPCIAMDSAEGAREIIRSGENGYLIKNRNTNMMVRKIGDLIRDRDERVKIGENARKSVGKYTSDAIGEEWFTLIEESDVYE